MKKRIAILGSTGSIGKTTFNIIKENKKDFNVVLLTTNQNINEIIKQTQQLKVENILVSNKKKFLKLKDKLKKSNIKIFNNFKDFNKIIKKKLDYAMCAISGLDGLNPTINIIKSTKNVAIANKESIICGWNLIDKELKKYKTKFIPVDSEHFSIWSSINKINQNLIDQVILTASGGPFLKKNNKFLKKATIKSALKHPNWKMGKKISIDSATLMNKVFEFIEAMRIFDLKKDKLSILIHPKSYVHSIVKFSNGLINITAHDTNMKIPIFNSIYFPNFKKINTKNIDYKVLNNLSLFTPSYKKFPSLKLINSIGNKTSLYETILISANDCLVDLFIKKKIKFTDIINNLIKILNIKEFKAYKYKKPSNGQQILNLSEHVRLKTIKLCIK
tara:strand:- start:60 stop:1226 length:1167 start_codon:yes stop_codon:yes gene_type:complete